MWLLISQLISEDISLLPYVRGREIFLAISLPNFPHSPYLQVIMILYRIYLCIWLSNNTSILKKTAWGINVNREYFHFQKLTSFPPPFKTSYLTSYWTKTLRNNLKQIPPWLIGLWTSPSVWDPDCTHCGTDRQAIVSWIQSCKRLMASSTGTICLGER